MRLTPRCDEKEHDGGERERARYISTGGNGARAMIEGDRARTKE